jgi:diaminopimelate decarboxylase
VYDEATLRERCREMKRLVKYADYNVNYTPKANGNLALLQIIRDEGLDAEAMSPGEIHINLAAGFKPEQILYIATCVSEEEMLFAMEKGICTSIDSLSQLKRYGRLSERTGLGKQVAIRINPGVGAGHHQKVVTGGGDTKFGINLADLPMAKSIIKAHKLTLIGLNHHIGSGVTDGAVYLAAAETMLEQALQFKDLKFIDFGGGFYINYKKLSGGGRYDFTEVGERLDALIADFTQRYGKKIRFKTELGRYIVAEAGKLVGTVHAVKCNGEKKFIGTDIGMNVIMRPVIYNSHHDIEIQGKTGYPKRKTEKMTVVGNICETGDILAKSRRMPKDTAEGDVIIVHDAGAYGYSMCSTYNARLRPAEVLIRESGEAVLIRRRDSVEDLTRGFITL